MKKGSIRVGNVSNESIIIVHSILIMKELSDLKEIAGTVKK